MYTYKYMYSYIYTYYRNTYIHIYIHAYYIPLQPNPKRISWDTPPSKKPTPNSPAPATYICFTRLSSPLFLCAFILHKSFLHVCVYTTKVCLPLYRLLLQRFNRTKPNSVTCHTVSLSHICGITTQIPCDF